MQNGLAWVFKWFFPVVYVDHMVAAMLEVAVRGYGKDTLMSDELGDMGRTVMDESE